MARYTSSGALDTGFGPAHTGKVAMSSSPASKFQAVALQADGKIVVAGQYDDKLTVARFTAAGDLDTSFDSDGLASVNLVGESWAAGVKVGDDGRIVAAGSLESTTTGYDLLVACFNSDGSHDDTFGLDGVFATDFGSAADHGGAVVIDGTGRVLVAGYSYFSYAGDWGNRATLIRLTSQGYLDPTFGIQGKVWPTAANHLIAQGLQLDSLGRPVLAGVVEFEASQSWLMRFSSNGAIDHGFGVDGVKMLINADACTLYGGVYLDSQGRLLGAGTSGNNALVTRHQSDDHTNLWGGTWWWSDPERNDSYLVDTNLVTIRTTAMQDIWNCQRGQAPMFYRNMPGGNWAVEATVQVSDLQQDTLAGLLLWNGEESGSAVHTLYVGLTNLLGTPKLTIQGSIPELCSKQMILNDYLSQSVTVKIVRSGNDYTFYYAQIIDAWSELGTVTTAAEFSKVGFIAKTWDASNDLDAQFSFFDLNLSGAAACLDLLLNP